VSGSVDEAIRQTEAGVGFSFPADYIGFVRESGGTGTVGWFGEMYLMLFPIGDLAELHRVHNDAEHMPGFVAFGSDGGGELFGFDFRASLPLIVMVGNVSSGWSDAIVQASSFDEFMDKRRRDEPFDFSTG
jgi:hypothetical protein